MADLITHSTLQPAAKPERVIIMLHGIGQHGGYMQEAGQAFSDRMPNTLIVMPDAPLKMHYSDAKTARIREKYDPGFDPTKARSWFPTDTYRWPDLLLRVAFNKVGAVHDINKLADHYRDKYGLQDKDIAFFGMSQGSAISLYAATARSAPIAAVVSHTGMFFGFSRTTAKPDVLMITGEKDDYLCDNKSKMRGFFLKPENSLRRLKRRGIPTTEIRLPELGHEMTAQSIAEATSYLAKAFNVAVAAPVATPQEASAAASPTALPRVSAASAPQQGSKETHALKPLGM